VRQELQSGLCPADVPARLGALHDHAVCAGRAREKRLVDRAALVQPHPRRAPERPAPEGHDDVRAARHAPVARAGEREQQVHGHGPPGQGARGVQLALQHGRRVGADRPQAAGLRDGRGQLVARDAAAHPGLYDRQLDAEALEESAQTGVAASSSRSRRRSASSD
jgi:hypothetical protein